MPGTTAPIAELRNVTKLFGPQAALCNLSLTLEQGSITVLLGQNGAGKSTLLRLLAGLASPTSGTLRLFGGDPATQRHRIAYMSHAPMLYDELSATENLTYFASLHRPPDACDCAASPEMALRAVGLDPQLTRPVSQYSQGMRQRASLARVLHLDPDLLLLDEPFSNLDAPGAQHMVELLADFRTWPSPRTPSHPGQYARTIVLTTHQAHLAAPIATRTLTLRNGTLHPDSPESTVDPERSEKAASR